MTNFIVILADDLGFSDIGCYGSEIQTPNLDRLAFSGKKFSQFYNTARCCSSRAALLTGLYPHQAGIGHMIDDWGVGPAYQGYLRDDAATIAEILQQAGYRTLMSGKWHLNWTFENLEIPEEEIHARLGSRGYPHPIQRGFDRYYGTVAGASDYFNPRHLLSQDKFIGVEDPSFYYTDSISEQAEKMIDEAVALKQPFFLHLSYTAPHWPLQGLPEDIAKYQDRYLTGWDHLRQERYSKLKTMGLLSNDWDLSARDPFAPAWQSLDAKTQAWEASRMAVYAAQVDRMDQGIGRVLRALDRHALTDDTVVIFLSDNGGCAEFLREDGFCVWYDFPTREGKPMQLGNRQEVTPGPADTFSSYGLPWANASNAPFRLFKRYVHEGGIATPMIFSWPRKLTQNNDGIVHEPCHMIDLAPTLLDIARVSAPREYRGRDVQRMAGESLLPLLQGQTWTRSKPIGFEHEGNKAIRFKEWKAVAQRGGPWELYNMNHDRTETSDLAIENAPQLQQMVRMYADWATKCDVREWPPAELPTWMKKVNAEKPVGL